MQITLNIPDELVAKLANTPEELARRAIESLVVAAYCNRQLSAAEVQSLLKLPSHLATDTFLKQHHAYIAYGEENLEQDLLAISRAIEGK